MAPRQPVCTSYILDKVLTPFPFHSLDRSFSLSAFYFKRNLYAFICLCKAISFLILLRSFALFSMSLIMSFVLGFVLCSSTIWINFTNCSLHRINCMQLARNFLIQYQKHRNIFPTLHKFYLFSAFTIIIYKICCCRQQRF